MDILIAEKLMKKLEPLLNEKFAITDIYGEVLAKSASFEIEKNPLKINLNPKALLIRHKGEKIGFIYIDESKKQIKDVEKVLLSMTELYLDQLIFLSDIPSFGRHLDKFVYDLLHKDVDEDILKAEARALKIDILKPRVAIVLLIGGVQGEIFKKTEISGEEKEDQIQRIKEKLQRAIDSFYTRHTDNIIAYAGENAFVVLKDIGGEAELEKNLSHFKDTIDSIHYIIRNELRSIVTIGIGSFYEGIKGLGQSFGEAIFTAKLGEQVWGEDKMYHFDSFGVVAPLVKGEDETRESYSKDLFSKFSNRDEALRTLETFFDCNMSLTKTAEKLKIHRNTLVYRLDKITEATGLDPRVFDDAVQVKLAMLFTSFAIGGVV